MTDNVIYGIDFRAGKEEAPLCNAPDIVGVPSSQVLGRTDFNTSARPDTAPSEYCPPDGDCA
ncbi:hypothetical protein [Tardiphaga sp. 367_B4_N1_1]|uniref:hypothetical protein n=1 Tax=Tardiphaga sp. 367_B4_N1_1 TaxID=3240777 RepID=UPI003F28C802